MRIRSVFCFAGLSLAALPAAAGALNDTGQIACYDASLGSSGVEVSVGTPTPEPAGFEGQDCTAGAAAADVLGAQVKAGGSSAAGRDYSKIGNDGSVLANDAARGNGPADWGCTRDNITGLIWELKPDDGTLRDVDHLYSWYVTDASVNGGNAGAVVPPPEGDPLSSDTCGATLAQCNTTAYLEAVNALAGGVCGASDWRLPSPTELQSLFHYHDPFDDVNFVFTYNLIDRVWFPDQRQGGAGLFYYMSGQSEPSDSTGDSAWIADFQFGGIKSYLKEFPMFIRLVRGGAQ